MKPDRLIIEPTGLGHPKEIIAILTSPQYCDYVDLKATIALVDPSYFSDDRYTTNQNFNDQLDSADIVIANKADTSTDADLTEFKAWLDKQQPSKEASSLTTQGEFDLQFLDVARSEKINLQMLKLIIMPMPTWNHNFLYHQVKIIVEKRTKGRDTLAVGGYLHQK